MNRWNADWINYLRKYISGTLMDNSSDCCQKFKVQKKIGVGRGGRAPFSIHCSA